MANEFAMIEDGSKRGRSKGAVLNGLELFLRGTFLRADCERIELRHRTANGNPVVRDWVLDDIEPEMRGPDTVGEQVIIVAQEDANSLKGAATYSVLTYRKGNPSPCARHQFTVYGTGGPLESGDILGETEPPNAVGLVAQTQRHLEALVRVMIGGYAQSMQYQQAIIRTLAEQNDKMSAREERVMSLHEELSNAQHERKLELIREEKGDARKDRILDKAETLLPAFFGKLAKTTDAKVALATDGIRQVAKTLTPEQMAKLGDVLTPEQQIAFGTAYQAFAEEQDEKDAKKKETPK